ncbi:MAG TPA: hypothetical protein VK146_13605 [Tabrizicola sp.]|nr:hypothetical protein [Tabrizicola sp.]
MVCAASLLSACQGALGGKSPAGVTPNAVLGDSIEVTTLDTPPPDGNTPGPVPAGPSGAETAAPQEAAATPADPAEPSGEAGAPAPVPDAAETPVTPKSEQQLACEKKKGRWLRVGKGSARACVFQTKDAGKRCERESQCEGVCLARSGTCSPLKPLYGCNEILQDNGARVTLCLD